MHPNDPQEFLDTEPVEPTIEAIGAAPGPHWTRRGFLKAAALGTAAAALLHKGGDGLQFGPLTAYADNLSGLNCTANDVRIIGPGQIINEPCACTGTFNAQVKFRINNNTGTTRYCVTVHFCPATLPGGGTFTPGDVLIGDIPPGEADYTVTIPNYPCGAGLVCFGARGPEADGSFPKGTACPSGQCCTTISWDVNPGCPTNVIKSKCRHQQICIQGRGGATLDCNTATDGVQAACTVACGGTATVRLCTAEPASQGPFDFVLKVPGQTDQTFTGAGPCHDFTVGGLAADTTITGTVKSKDGCTKTSNSVTLTVTAISLGASTVASSPCSGIVTFQAGTVTGGSGTPAFSFSLDGAAFVAGTGTGGNQFVYNPTVGTGGLDTTCHRLVAKVVRGGCEATSPALTFSQCVQTTTGCTPPATP